MKLNGDLLLTQGSSGSNITRTKKQGGKTAKLNEREAKNVNKNNLGEAHTLAETVVVKGAVLRGRQQTNSNCGVCQSVS